MLVHSAWCCIGGEPEPDVFGTPPFDGHAMIFTKEASGLENLLQRRSADRRFILVNLRTESLLCNA